MAQNFRIQGIGGILHWVSASPPACGEVVVAKGACMDSYPADHNVWQQLAGPRDKSGGDGEDGVAAPSPEMHRVPTLAPQEVLLDAACAFDSLARYVTASNFDQLSKTQADAVMRIALFGPASMTELASGLGVSKEHVTRAVAGLEEQGLVTKRRNDENRRIVEAVLTERGEKAVTAIRLASIERLEKPLSSLSPAERDELVDLSTRAVALLLRIRLG